MSFSSGGNQPKYTRWLWSTRFYDNQLGIVDQLFEVDGRLRLAYIEVPQTVTVDAYSYLAGSVIGSPGNIRMALFRVLPGAFDPGGATLVAGSDTGLFTYSDTANVQRHRSLAAPIQISSGLYVLGLCGDPTTVSDGAFIKRVGGLFTGGNPSNASYRHDLPNGSGDTMPTSLPTTANLTESSKAQVVVALRITAVGS